MVQLLQLSLKVMDLRVLRRFIGPFYIINSLTVFEDLLLFPDQPAHPQRVAVVKDEALVVRILRTVILQDMRALLILPQLE